MTKEQIKTEYIALLNKPILQHNDLQRSRILVGMWKKSNRWNEDLKQYVN